jgi:prephenate dehydrogenase
VIARLTVIGVGLIGGSLARALRAGGAAGEIVGCGRDPSRLARAKKLGVIDRFETDPAKAVAGADAVVVCAPVGAMAELFAALRPGLAPQAVVTDAGSAKGLVVEAARAAFGGDFARFVPGHPIAGTEHSGVEASFAELYQGRRVILTPGEETVPDALARVTAMWEASGATVTRMTPAHHDEVLAATSHLPHVLAYTLVEALAVETDPEAIFAHAGGGFADFTRVASSDPAMWVDIVRANRTEVLAALDRYLARLTRTREAIDASNYDALQTSFARAKAARDRFTARREEDGA